MLVEVACTLVLAFTMLWRRQDVYQMMAPSRYTVVAFDNISQLKNSKGLLATANIESIPSTEMYFFLNVTHICCANAKPTAAVKPALVKNANAVPNRVTHCWACVPPVSVASRPK